VRKLTPKQEKFCQLFVETGNAAESYRQSYNVTSKPNVVYVKASELLNSGSISVRVSEIRAELAASKKITLETLLGELEEARKIALESESPQTSAAVSATMGKAKLLGLDKQVIDHKSSDGSMTPKAANFVIGDEAIKSLADKLVN
jgi:phage terminase small subunit